MPGGSGEKNIFFFGGGLVLWGSDYREFGPHELLYFLSLGVSVIFRGLFWPSSLFGVYAGIKYMYICICINIISHSYREEDARLLSPAKACLTWGNVQKSRRGGIHGGRSLDLRMCTRDTALAARPNCRSSSARSVLVRAKALKPMLVSCPHPIRATLAGY